MESRKEKTIERHNRGYNCAQAVACTYCDLVGVDEDTMFRMMEGYGLGMGGTRGVCGAASGVIVLAGMVNSKGCENPVSKGGTYKLSKEVLDAFETKTGSLICREIKGVETGKVLRSCSDCILDGAELAEKMLFSKRQ